MTPYQYQMLLSYGLNQNQIDALPEPGTIKGKLIQMMSTGQTFSPQDMYSQTSCLDPLRRLREIAEEVPGAVIDKIPAGTKGRSKVFRYRLRFI